jgi:hypothetical protein
LSKKISICLGCGNQLEKEVQTGIFITSTYIFLCSKCQRLFHKEFQVIKKSAIEVIQRNKKLNNLFDSFIDSEEILKPSHANQETIYFNSSKQVREYMFSLLEEVHRFAYHSSFESYLFCEMFADPDPLFFSERFFLTNAVIKIIGAWEKMFLFYSLFYEIELSEEGKNNSLVSLLKKLRKTDFIKTRLYQEYIKLKSNGSFKRIDSARKYNDHNVSYHLGNNFKEITYVAKDIVTNTSIIYSGIEEALRLLGTRVRLAERDFVMKYKLFNKFKENKENDKLFKKKALKIKRYFNLEDVYRFYLTSKEYMDWAEQRLEDASSWKIRFSSPPLLSIYYMLIDITTRLHEAARSLGYSIEMFRDAVELKYTDLDEYWIKFDGMNYRYFIYSALIRVYAVYDKLSVVIRDLFEIDIKNSSLEKTIKYMQSNKEFNFYLTLPPFKTINRILSSKSYKRLYNSRQDFFHLLVIQDFMSPKYKEILDTELIIAIIENSLMIYELINSIDIALVNLHQLGYYHAMENKIKD